MVTSRMNNAQKSLTASFPPPRSAENSARQNRDDSPASEATTIDPNLSYCHMDPNPSPERCQLVFSDGRQCRMPRYEIHPRLCRFHKEREEEELFGSQPSYETRAAIGLPELEAVSRDLTTPNGVNRALGQVFRLLAQRRISRQEAVAFGYLARLMLQTISIARAQASHSTILSEPTSGEEQRTAPKAAPARDICPSPSSPPERISPLIDKPEAPLGGFLMKSDPDRNPSSIFCRPAMPAVSREPGDERFMLSGSTRGGPFVPEDQRSRGVTSQLTQIEHLQILET